MRPIKLSRRAVLLLLGIHVHFIKTSSFSSPSSVFQSARHRSTTAGKSQIYCAARPPRDYIRKDNDDPFSSPGSPHNKQNNNGYNYNKNNSKNPRDNNNYRNSGMSGRIRVIPISVAKPGPIGVGLQRNKEESVVVSSVMKGSPGDWLGLQPGDVICYKGTHGREDVNYHDFLSMVKSNVRPLQFEVRRMDQVEPEISHVRPKKSVGPAAWNSDGPPPPPKSVYGKRKTGYSSPRSSKDYRNSVKTPPPTNGVHNKKSGYTPSDHGDYLNSVGTPPSTNGSHENRNGYTSSDHGDYVNSVGTPPPTNGSHENRNGYTSSDHGDYLNSAGTPPSTNGSHENRNGYTSSAQGDYVNSVGTPPPTNGVHEKRNGYTSSAQGDYVNSVGTPPPTNDVNEKRNGYTSSAQGDYVNSVGTPPPTNGVHEKRNGYTSSARVDSWSSVDKPHPTNGVNEKRNGYTPNNERDSWSSVDAPSPTYGAHEKRNGYISGDQGVSWSSVDTTPSSKSIDGNRNAGSINDNTSKPTETDQDKSSAKASTPHDDAGIPWYATKPESPTVDLEQLGELKEKLESEKESNNHHSEDELVDESRLVHQDLIGKVAAHRHIYRLSPAKSSIQSFYSIEERQYFSVTEERTLRPLREKSVIFRGEPSFDESIEYEKHEIKLKMGPALYTVEGLQLKDEDPEVPSKSIWESSFVLALVCMKFPKLISGKGLEVGGGVGIGGILSTVGAGVASGIREAETKTETPVPDALAKITLTDTNENNLNQCIENLGSVSFPQSKAELGLLDWNSKVPDNLKDEYNFVIGSDCAHYFPLIAPLAKTVAHSLKSSPYDWEKRKQIIRGSFLHVGPENEKGIDYLKLELGMGYRMNTRMEEVVMEKFTLAPLYSDNLEDAEARVKAEIEGETDRYLEYEDVESRKYSALVAYHDEDFDGERGENFFPIEKEERIRSDLIAELQEEQVCILEESGKKLKIISSGYKVDIKVNPLNYRVHISAVPVSRPDEWWE